ncbi:flagellar biosynthesis protein FliQ [Bacillus licheniformis]|uniref:flagellar biosynthesis protein FliQ n=1 Tax=Bacillus licheniformis TaxID=1402 RepID=UPI000949792E|nr:flagellar biosynthesis protein FliQ [Bacillus licheniformis]MDE1421157.1 flagellar biosynthesis protein FliQ [Bacillus licheniformis]MEC2289199.1 flagellar biosynthesis protein FliQ [Bacillus licheniformis]MEC5251418.1 flagellar biosynthesis protein FliQ [Bacillus licheniformis]OLF89474.1 Flagellar biosynthesis protein FliQ [Bacillus licheniformis]
MNSEFVISMAERAVYVTLLISGPLLALALLVGLIVSVFQATTQIQEQTLAFIPKIVTVLVGLVVFGPWMLSTILSFATELFSNLNRFAG